MKNHIKKYGLLLAAGLFAVQAAAAQDEGLPLGTPAPPLSIMKWAKGKPVKKFEKGKLYLVEFTGTGCPPCRCAMPHLTKISRLYREKIQVVSVFDGLSNTGLPVYMGIFNALLNEYGDKMDYTVAVDQPNNITINAWKAIGVPQVFLVDTEGKIAWKGLPVEMDTVIAYAVKGELAKGVALVQGQHDRMEAIYNEINVQKKAGNWKRAVNIIDSMITLLRPEDHFALHRLYTTKYTTLAGNHDERAYEWLDWMLADENREWFKAFDWDHLAGDVRDRPKFKKLDAQLRVIDRCIELAEYKYIAGASYSGKAYAYKMFAKHRDNPADAKKDSLHAVEMYTKAIELLMQSGEETQFVAEMYDERSRVQQDPKVAADDRKQAILLYRKAVEEHIHSKAPVKLENFPARMEERIMALQQL